MKQIERIHANGKIETFAEDEASQLVPHEIVLFPSLRFWVTHCKSVKRRSCWVKPDSFPKLEDLKVIGSKDEDMVNFPFEMHQILYGIENITFQHVFELVKVFKNGKESNRNYESSTVVKVKHLTLNNLPDLTHVWDDNLSCCFDSLEKIEIERCKKLKYLLPSSITFFNLTRIAVDYCTGMMHLFKSSVAKDLVNLKGMSITNCTEMSCIVDVAEEEEESREEEIVFNRLEYLELYNLPRLTCFCFGKCLLKFFCLKILDIKKCPEMKTFSYGKISAPKLLFMSMEREKLSTTHGINAIIEDTWNDEILRSIKNLFTKH
ncbi:uncharacterized protein LOC120078722 [Benincasa hispida]|uniref:uncharacterized protein LOC120078722 n=1 Tax=Benincasa hispida TaxID=102211 RepID=UPI001900D6D3|nr:uncharacterized protein LOC120078722 [Benincasa hispida]